MKRRETRNPVAHGRSKTQSYVLLAARSGKLFDGGKDLLFVDSPDRFHVVHTFGRRQVKECEKAGWLLRIPHPNGWEKIMTTCAGDAELARPLQLRKPVLNAYANVHREALR